MKHILLSIGLLLSAAGLRAELGYLEQISVETFAKMREVERFQIKVAEKLYLKGEYKAAASEYEKFLTLYERSTAAPYAQLMWSHCLVKQRKVYTQPSRMDFSRSWIIGRNPTRPCLRDF